MGYFFDGSQMNASDRDDLITAAEDNVDLYGLQPFRRIKVPPYIVLLIAVIISLGFVSIVLPFVDLGLKSVSPLTPLIGCHCLAWIITSCLQFILHKQHKTSRTYGYLDLYRQTASLRRAPLIILSIGSICLLITVSIVDTLCSRNPSYVNCRDDWPHRLVYYVQGILLLEVAVIIVNLSIYLRKTVLFNREKPPPDVDLDECGYLTANNTINDIGFRDDSEIDDVLEKQADMIRYLKRHNIFLSKKIFHLTNDVHATNTTGQTTNATGQSNNATGQSNNATGQTTNATGQSNNATGQTTNVTGQSNNATGQSNNATVQTTNATGQTINTAIIINE